MLVRRRCICCAADNDVAMYNKLRKAGVDAIIMDDVAKLTKVKYVSQ